jgi:hypothetical protein
MVRSTPEAEACGAEGEAYRPQCREGPVRKIFRLRSLAGRGDFCG